MFVSKRKYKALQEKAGVLEEEIGLLKTQSREQFLALNEAQIRTESLSEQVRTLESRLADARQGESELGASLETCEQFLNKATKLAEQFERERDEAIREGAKLADELVELRKTPEIEGPWFRFFDGTERYVPGCVSVLPFRDDDTVLWGDLRNRFAISLGMVRSDQIIETTWQYVAPKASKRGKK